MTVGAQSRSAREVVLATFDAVRAHDVDGIVADAHPEDYVDDFVAVGEFRGRDAVRGFFRELFAAVPDFDMTVERVVADESAVAVKWRARGTFTGAPFQGILATGRAVEIRGLDFFELDGEVIRRNTIFYDGASFARQIGMLPCKGSRADRMVLSLFNLRTRLRRLFRR